MTCACIFGCAGTGLTADEAAFFADARPWGFILFRRNIETPEQVRDLTGALRASIDRPDAPVLIDQEGGRVQRMRPPHWSRYPAAGAFGEVADADTRREMVRLGARLMAHDLAAVGINVDCMPVLDVPTPGAHDVIGDRAYGMDPQTVASMGRAACEGMLAGGVLPVVKHMPGHGRAGADSHFALPVVEAPYADLAERDFLPFRALADMPMAMTAHVVYADIDARRPATTSPMVISRVIRGAIGFDGLLISDDLSMEALAGDLAQRAKASLEAGCDVVLHCNGDLEQMRAVAGASKPLAGRAAGRASSALACLTKAPEPFDVAEARARFEAGFAGRRAA